MMTDLDRQDQSTQLVVRRSHQLSLPILTKEARVWRCSRCRQRLPYGAFDWNWIRNCPAGYCKRCKREYNIERRKLPTWPETQRRYNRRFYETHPESRARQVDRKRQKFNADQETRTRKQAMNRRYAASPAGRLRQKARRKKYEATQRGLMAGRVKSQRRRARKRAVPSACTPADVAKVLATAGGECGYCGLTTDRLTVDHVVAIVNGGWDTPSNLLACCRPCNASKGARDVREWAATKLSPQRLSIVLATLSERGA